MSEPLKRKIRGLKRLVLAQITFQQVVAGCKFLFLHDSDEYAQFYGVFFAGICVSYMRPFMSSEGLGPLPQKYSEFCNEGDYARTHDDLSKGRNYAFGHYSPGQAATLLANQQQRDEQRRIRLIVSSTGITFVPPEVTWPKSRLPAIVSLCEFQISRIEAEVDDLVANLGKDKTYANGMYIIGETFP